MLSQRIREFKSCYEVQIRLWNTLLCQLILRAWWVFPRRGHNATFLKTCRGWMIFLMILFILLVILIKNTVLARVTWIVQVKLSFFAPYVAYSTQIWNIPWKVWHGDWVSYNKVDYARQKEQLMREMIDDKSCSFSSLPGRHFRMVSRRAHVSEQKWENWNWNVLPSCLMLKHERIYQNVSTKLS